MSTTSTTSQPLCIAVLSASDTRTPTDDRSGDLIRTSLQKVGHQIYCHEIIREDFDILKNRVASLIDEPTVEVVILTGGTGITRRDVSPDVVQALGTKYIPGFGELFRWLSYRDIGSSTIQSRACAWLCTDTLVFSLPGSTGAVKLALEEILIPQLDIDHRPCNFAQLLPRVREY